MIRALAAATFCSLLVLAGVVIGVMGTTAAYEYAHKRVQYSKEQRLNTKKVPNGYSPNTILFHNARKETE